MSQESLDAKARKWNSLQSKRFGSSKKTAFVDTGKQSLPAEHVRKIIKVSRALQPKSPAGPFSIREG